MAVGPSYPRPVGVSLGKQAGQPAAGHWPVVAAAIHCKSGTYPRTHLHRAFRFYPPAFKRLNISRPGILYSKYLQIPGSILLATPRKGFIRMSLELHLIHSLRCRCSNFTSWWMTVSLIRYEPECIKSYWSTINRWRIFLLGLYRRALGFARRFFLEKFFKV